MTDLLQTAVNVGTARAAQIGRPVAGKTGTTSSNKDAWFLGFSSGLTTGVWMGRDDAKPNPGLSGGHNPAQAFSAYMQAALRTRPGPAVPDAGDPARMAAGAGRGGLLRRSRPAVRQRSRRRHPSRIGSDQPRRPRMPRPCGRRSAGRRGSTSAAPRRRPIARFARRRSRRATPRIDQRWLDNVLREQRPRQRVIRWDYLDEPGSDAAA